MYIDRLSFAIHHSPFTITAMLSQLAEIFFNVITPVFALVLIGYFAGPRLGLDARTLSRYPYFILIPAFVFDVISRTKIEANLAFRMMTFAVVVHIACACLGAAVAWAFGRSPKMIAAYVLVATFGNVGNFGLPIIEFHLGPDSIGIATVYFLAIMVISFIICVAAANIQTGGSIGAVLAVLKTPALIAMVPAVLVSYFNLTPPVMVSRITGLLGTAMVPTMLVALGVQLAQMERLNIDLDVILSSGVRLLGGASLALLLVGFFGLDGIERGAGIFQSAMPAAVLTSIIALEYDLLPDFVTKSVLFSTLASVITLTLLLAIV